MLKETTILHAMDICHMVMSMHQTQHVQNLAVTPQMSAAANLQGLQLLTAQHLDSNDLRHMSAQELHD